MALKKFLRTWRIIAALSFITAMGVAQAFAQQEGDVSPSRDKVDSLVSLVPQLYGDERLEALGTLVELTEDLPEQKQYLDRYLDEARRQKNTYLEGRALTLLVRYHFSQFDTDSVFTVAEEAIRFTRKHKQSNYLFTVQQTLIMRYRGQGQMLTALRIAEEAYAEAKELQETMPMARLLTAMGGIYEEMGQDEEALRYYGESIEVAAKNRMHTFLFVENYHLLANVAKGLERYDEVLRYADSLRVEINNHRRNSPNAAGLQVYCFCEQYYRAVAFAHLKRPEQSLEAIREAEALYLPQWNGTFYAALLDEMYIAYYLFAVKNYDKALEHIHRAARFYEDSRLEGNLIVKETDKASALFGKGEYKTAAETYLQVIQKKDSLNNERFYAQLNELRTIYELDKAQMEAEKRLAALRQQRAVIGGLVAACTALAVIVVLVVWSRRRIAEKNRGLFLRIKEQDAVLEELEAERRKNRDFTTAGQGEAPEKDPKEEMFLRLTLAMNERQLYVNSDIKRKDIALLTGTGENELNDCIRSHTGMSFIDYINHLRLEHARRLLFSGVSEKLTIEAIALSSGFKIRETFHRLFREKYRLTPSEYAKIAKQQSGEKA